MNLNTKKMKTIKINSPSILMFRDSIYVTVISVPPRVIFSTLLKGRIKAPKIIESLYSKLKIYHTSTQRVFACILYDIFCEKSN